MTMLELARVGTVSVYIIFKVSSGHLPFFCFDPNDYRQWYSDAVIDPFPLEKEDIR